MQVCVEHTKSALKHKRMLEKNKKRTKKVTDGNIRSIPFFSFIAAINL